MAEDNNKPACDYYEKKGRKGNGGSGMIGGVYFMAFIGAAVYYIMQATTFWGGVLGFLKAIVWPAMLTFQIFQYLHL
jgi:hypothetical protein